MNGLPDGKQGPLPPFLKIVPLQISQGFAGTFIMEEFQDQDGAD